MQNSLKVRARKRRKMRFAKHVSYTSVSGIENEARFDGLPYKYTNMSYGFQEFWRGRFTNTQAEARAPQNDNNTECPWTTTTTALAAMIASSHSKKCITSKVNTTTK